MGKSAANSTINANTIIVIVGHIVGREVARVDTTTNRSHHGFGNYGISEKDPL